MEPFFELLKDPIFSGGLKNEEWKPLKKIFELSIPCLKVKMFQRNEEEEEGHVSVE